MKRLVWLLLLSLASGQEIRRPTTDIDPGKIALGCSAGTVQTSSAMPKAWDGSGLTTSSVLAAAGNDTSSNVKSRLFTSWQSTANVYTALTLNINAESEGDGGDSAANSCVKYSVDGGLTYTTVKCEAGQGYTRQTFSISLSPTVNLSKLRVGACVFGGKGFSRQQLSPGFDDVVIFDIWTAGTNPAPATGNGSTAGQPHRGAVVSN